MKFFDSKFIIILGLSVIVYFLYREVESLNKRITRIESTQNGSPVTLSLPLPLPEDDNDIKVITIQDNVNTDNTVEEYSNDIYSNDMGNSNTIEQDTLMLDSLVNMTNNDYKIQTETSEEDDGEEDVDEDDKNSVKSHTSVVNEVNTSPVNFENKQTSDKKNDISNLLKNKLNELQELAQTNNISIIVEGTNKKKTKQQLAEDINECINKKNI